MNFAVKKAWGSQGRARRGVLELSNCQLSVETPALMINTRKGLPVFISPDHLSSLPSPDSYLLQFSPLHFLEGPTPKTISNIGGVHQLLGLNDYAFAAIPRDDNVCIPDYSSTNKLGASFQTPCGRLPVNIQQYMEMISSMKPNLWATLADEVPASVTDKRNKISVDRTVKWLEDCIKHCSTNKTGGAVFGSVVGGCSVEQRKRCAQEVATKNVSGR